MSQYFSVMTTLGEQLLANATALGLPLKLTQMSVGDGNGQVPTPAPSQKQLIHETYRSAINTLTVDAKNPKQVIAELVIPDNVGGFWLREVGLFDDKGNLIAVGNVPETYKPQLTEGSAKTQVIRMLLAVNNTSNVELKIDPAVVLATREYVDRIISTHEKSTNHPNATITQKGMVKLNSALDSTSETEAATPAAIKKVNDSKVKKSGDTMTGPLKLESTLSLTNAKYPTLYFTNEAADQLIQTNPAGDLVFYLQGSDGNPATRLKWLKSINTWSMEYSNLSVKGGLSTTDEISTTSINSYRIAFAGQGFFIRNDGLSTCLMLTNKNDPYGNFNIKLRPLIINNTTGDLESWHTFIAREITSYGLLKGKEVYDSGHRVYSPNNPPPKQVPTGVFLPFGGAVAPAGYMKVNGSAIDQTKHPQLFAIFGEHLPDMRNVMQEDLYDKQQIESDETLQTEQTHYFARRTRTANEPQVNNLEINYIVKAE